MTQMHVSIYTYIQNVCVFYKHTVTQLMLYDETYFIGTVKASGDNFIDDIH